MTPKEALDIFKRNCVSYWSGLAGDGYICDYCRVEANNPDKIIHKEDAACFVIIDALSQNGLENGL